jgi:hypothetical protein
LILFNILSVMGLFKGKGFITLLRLIVLLVTGISSAVLAQEKAVPCPEFPIPHIGQAHWVAENMRMNGMPMQIKELTTEQTPQQVIAFYKQRWSDAPPYFHEYEVSGMPAIATLRSGCFYTVQVMSYGRGAKALLGVSTKPEAGQIKTPGAGFPNMAGSTILNDVDHYDSGKTGRTIMLTNSYSPDANLNFYRQKMAYDGWKAIMDRPVGGTKGISHVLVMKRGYHEANLTISPGSAGTSGTNVLATFVDKP